MAGASDYLENKLNDHWLRVASFTVPRHVGRYHRQTATGKFKYDLVQDEAGHWKAKWVGTGTVPHHDFWEWDVSNDPT